MKQPGNFQKPSLSFVCPEDWNSMSSCEQGRFCGSCQKTVVDFTQKSDAEILEMLSQRKEKVCGRFYAHQLNQPVQNRFSFRRVFSSVLVLLGLNFLSREADAQQKKASENKQSVKGKTTSKSKQSRRIPPEPNNIEYCKTETAKYLKEKRRKTANTYSKDQEIQEPFITVTGIIGVSEPPPDLLGIEATKDSVIVDFPEVMPVYKFGGEAGLQKFIISNLKVPPGCLKGIVVYSIVVGIDGKVSNPQLLKSLTPESDMEALRVVQLLEFIPGKQNFKVVPVRMPVIIRF